MVAYVFFLLVSCCCCCARGGGMGRGAQVSVYDHGAADPGMVYGENSKMGHMEHLGVDGIGACVWVR